MHISKRHNEAYGTIYTFRDGTEIYVNPETVGTYPGAPSLRKYYDAGGYRTDQEIAEHYYVRCGPDSDHAKDIVVCRLINESPYDLVLHGDIYLDEIEIGEYRCPVYIAHNWMTGRNVKGSDDCVPLMHELVGYPPTKVRADS